ncbi:MAG: flagellar hook-basal body complex protein FliE [Candidatus Margulisbacteria bacterium]|nr:flagellar hook-basal body complex protein FliE [Candidatus Margulisiibacteriota bacterium]
MAEKISPVNAELKLAQILNDDFLAQAPEGAIASPSVDIGIKTPASGLSANAFEDLLSRAVDSLNNVSQAEMHADQLIQKFRAGQAELHEVMIAQSKANILVQFAVTSINTAVTSFKEVLQIQI